MAKKKRTKPVPRRSVRIKLDHLKQLEAIGEKLHGKGHRFSRIQVMLDRAVERYLWIAHREANGYALTTLVTHAPTKLKLS